MKNLTPDDIILLFIAKAPIITDPRQRNHAMRTEEGKNNLILALMTFTAGIQFSHHVQLSHDWGDDNSSGVNTILSPDEDIANGFIEFVKAQNLNHSSYLSPLPAYFRLGVKAFEHVQDHEEFLEMLTNAADPEHPQVALPGIDFSVDEIIRDIKKRVK